MVSLNTHPSARGNGVVSPNTSLSAEDQAIEEMLSATYQHYGYNPSRSYRSRHSSNSNSNSGSNHSSKRNSSSGSSNSSGNSNKLNRSSQRWWTRASPCLDRLGIGIFSYRLGKEIQDSFGEPACQAPRHSAQDCLPHGHLQAIMRTPAAMCP